MVALFFELALPRWLRRNTCLPLLAWFLLAGARGQATNDETPNNAGGASPTVHDPPEGFSTVSYSAPYYPPPYQNWNENASNYANYNHQRPYQHRYGAGGGGGGGGYRQRNYRYQQNYGNRPPHYRRGYVDADKNGTDTRHQPWQRYPQQRVFHPNTDNPSANDNVNAEGARKSRLEAQAEVKKGKVGRFMGFVKNVFRKITGRKKQDEVEDNSTHTDDVDWTRQDKEDEQMESEGDRRNWGRNDRRPNRWRGGGGHHQHRNYNNPNYRNYPDQGYQKYRNPGDNPQGPNYNQVQQQGPNPNDGNQQQQDNRYENRRFHYKPYHYNHGHPGNSDHRQDQNAQDAAAGNPNYAPQNNEYSYTRSMDQTPQ